VFFFKKAQIFAELPMKTVTVIIRLFPGKYYGHADWQSKKANPICDILKTVLNFISTDLTREK
jgi:hypothetical protein